MARRALTLLQVYAFATRFRAAYAMCAAACAVGVASALIFRSTEGVAFAASAAVIGLALCLGEVIGEWRRSSQLRVERIEPGALRNVGLSATYRDYEVMEFQGYFAAYSRAVNALLDERPLRFVWRARPYRLRGAPNRLRWFTLHQKLQAGATLFNDAKVRLASDLTVERILRAEPLALHRTDYFSSLCANEMIMRRIVSTRRPVTLLDGLRLLAPDGVVPDLEASALSNHIGISSVAVTSDQYLVVSRQGARNAQSAGLLGPAGSGSLDRSDVAGASGDLGGLLKTAMQRELLEECGLAGKDIHIQTHLIGYARLLHRGGKPEFFGVSLVDAPLQELRIPPAERDFVAAIEGIPLDLSDASALPATLAAYAQDNAQALSIQLRLTLQFLCELLARAPGALQRGALDERTS